MGTPYKLSEEKKIEIVEKYLSGNISCRALGREYNVSYATILYTLKSRKIKINNDKQAITRKYTVNQNYFDIINTEAKAYFLGLLYADGCNSGSGKIEIGLGAKDVDILEKFRKELETNKPLSFVKSKNPNHQDKFVLSIASQHMCNRLIILGCVPRKSLILKFPKKEQIPAHLLNHFIRGYFDGDGHYGISKNRCGKFSLLASCISTFDFNNELRECLLNKMNIKISIRSSKGNEITSELKTTNNYSCISLINFLYHNSAIFMIRKYNKTREQLVIYQSQMDAKRAKHNQMS